jgi:hypothetical protein
VARSAAADGECRNRHVVVRVSVGDKGTKVTGLLICGNRWRGRREAVMFKQHSSRVTWKPLAGLGVLAILAVAMLLLAGCQSSSNAPAAGTDATGTLAIETITVNGEGKVSVTPDEAIVSVAVETDAADAASALDTNSKDMQKVLDALKAQGIKDTEIETANVAVYPNRQYDPQTGKETLVGYRAQNSVTVTLTDLTKVPAVFAAATEAGANNITGPVWQLSDNNQAVNEALTRATENALGKAQTLATASGVKVGSILVLNEGSVSSPPIFYADQALASGASKDSSVTPPPTSPQMIEVTASVTATYRMER